LFKVRSKIRKKKSEQGTTREQKQQNGTQINPKTTRHKKTGYEKESDSKKEKTKRMTKGQKDATKNEGKRRTQTQRDPPEQQTRERGKGKITR